MTAPASLPPITAANDVNGLGDPLTQFCEHRELGICVYCRPTGFRYEIRLLELRRVLRGLHPDDLAVVGPLLREMFQL